MTDPIVSVENDGKGKECSWTATCDHNVHTCCGGAFMSAWGYGATETEARRTVQLAVTELVQGLKQPVGSAAVNVLEAKLYRLLSACAEALPYMEGEGTKEEIERFKNAVAFARGEPRIGGWPLSSS